MYLVKADTDGGEVWYMVNENMVKLDNYRFIEELELVIGNYEDYFMSNIMEIRIIGQTI